MTAWETSIFRFTTTVTVLGSLPDWLEQSVADRSEYRTFGGPSRAATHAWPILNGGLLLSVREIMSSRTMLVILPLTTFLLTLQETWQIAGSNRLAPRG